MTLPFDDQGDEEIETVGGVAELYLGNILYALELASMSLEKDNKVPDAAFYRAIARKLARVHGEAKARRGEA